MQTRHSRALREAAEHHREQVVGPVAGDDVFPRHAELFRDPVAQCVGSRVGVAAQFPVIERGERLFHRGRGRKRIFIRVELAEVLHLRLFAGDVALHRVDLFAEIRFHFNCCSCLFARPREVFDPGGGRITS